MDLIHLPYVFSFDPSILNKLQNCHSQEHVRSCSPCIISLAQINSQKLSTDLGVSCTDKALRGTNQIAFALHSALLPGRAMTSVGIHCKREVNKIKDFKDSVSSELPPGEARPENGLCVNANQMHHRRDIRFFPWNFSGHEFSGGSELTYVIGFYSFPHLSHSQGVHEALREVHSPHQAANWSFGTLLHNLLPQSGKSTEQILIPYRYLHDIYSTFLQAVCREYLTSHINFRHPELYRWKQKKQKREQER